MWIFFLLFSFLAGASNLPEKIDTIRLKHGVPGLTAAYFSDGKSIEVILSGSRKAGFPEPLSHNDKFHLGSCTKAMTATLAATFIEDGKLRWKSSLAELLPDIDMHPAFKDVTFEMLLSHRSGLIPDQSWDDYLKWQKLPTGKAREVMAATLLKDGPVTQAGQFQYSNAGYITAGLIMERISGRSWEMLIQERLFSPLEMKSCGFGPTTDGSDQSPLDPWGHFLTDGNLIPSQTDNAPYYGPAASVHCSIKDWAKFLTLHVNGFNGKSSFLKPGSFKKLHEVYPADESTYTFGGWGRANREWAQGPVLNHNGNNVRNYARVLITPKKKSFIISTSNVSSGIGEKATDEVINVLLDEFYR